VKLDCAARSSKFSISFAFDFNLAFLPPPRKTLLSFMQAQDTTTDFFFKLWPWLEANSKRILYGAAFLIIVVFVVSFYSWRQNQKEIAAGEAMTQALISGTGQIEASLKVATDYSGTRGGERALLQGAALLFTSGKYPDAQTQFQKFLDTYPDSSFLAEADLGIAASLDAQNKTDLAVSAYQRAVNQASSDLGVSMSAKYALAQIKERQGKISDAQKLYEDVARSFPNSSLGSEAALRAVELQTKPTATVSAPASAPFNLTQ
jgi:tetratricopeptide (TPR) repeat protein